MILDLVLEIRIFRFNFPNNSVGGFKIQIKINYYGIVFQIKHSVFKVIDHINLEIQHIV